MEKEKSTWVDLYNGLYILSSSEEIIRQMETPIFEVLDELDTALEMGFSQQSLESFYDYGWINHSALKELQSFNRVIHKIDLKFWNLSDFLEEEDWLIIREWSKKIFHTLNMKDNGFDSTGIQIIYTDD